MENLIRVAIIAAACAFAEPQLILGQEPDIESMKRSLEAQIGLYQRVNERERRVTNLEQKVGDPTTASETVAPSPGSVAAPPKDAAAEFSICQCQGFKHHMCHCLKAGVKCRCSRTVGSEWNMVNGRAVSKTGRYADPRQGTQPARSRPAASAPSDNSVPTLKSDGFYWWQGPNGKWYNWSTMPAEGVVGRQQDGTLFVMRNGKMVPHMAVQIQQPAGGRWVKRCYGSYCRMEWVPN